jgi:predicted HicB family RNase H-like nuclease
MNTMTYKGYTARVEYDDRDSILVGRILGIHSIISFHSETVSGLRKQFMSAVNDYLAECQSKGVAPEKSVSGKLLLRVPPEVHSKALVAAQAAGKSLNQWATELLERAVQASS